MRLFKWALALLFSAALAAPAFADSAGSATGGTAGTQSDGAGCIYQTPTLSAGQQATLACDGSGNLKVNLAAGGVISGSQSNAGAGTTGSTNVPVMGYNYYWNGSGWVQWTGTVSGSNIGGYDTGPVQVTATPANSSHAAGTSVGGLFTLSLARTSGGSGEITQVLFKSSGASTGQYVVRIWGRNPTNTTCTDNSAFAGSNTDDAQLITPPFSITPAAPAVTTGDANTYASVLNTNYGFLTSGNTNVYACVVTVATDTADENKAVYVTMDALQN